MKSRLVILASGQGGNLKFLSNVTSKGILNSFEISKVVAPKVCGATEFASANEIPIEIVNFHNPTQLTGSISETSPDLVISFVNQIIPAEVLANVTCRFVNLHYSLLPSFKGLIGKNTLSQAIEYGSLITGATVHEVTEDLDGGTPLSQVAFILNDDKSELIQMNTMFKAGCLAMYSYLSNLGTQHSPEQVNFTEISGNKFLISPPSSIPSICLDEASDLSRS